MRDGKSQPIKITQAELHRMLHYDPHTGVFTYRVRTNNRVRIGQVAGSVQNGYLRIQCNKQQVGLHRLAFLYMTGKDPGPEQFVDHINGTRDDNRWCNLRLVEKRQNQENRKLGSDNRHGLFGVQWRKRDTKWYAYIGAREGRRSLYWGDDFFEACCARKSAELKAGYHHNHGRKTA